MKGNVSITYLVNHDGLSHLSNKLKEIGCSSSDCYDNMSPIIKVNSKIDKYNIIQNKEAVSAIPIKGDVSGSIKLNSIITANFFNDRDDYRMSLVSFCFDFDDMLELLDVLNVNKFVNSFFSLNTELKSFRDANNNPFSMIFSKYNIKSFYLKLIPSREDEEVVEDLLRSKLKINRSQKLSGLISNQGGNHIQYINRKDNHIVDVAKFGERRDLKVINQFMIATAYLNFYRAQIEHVTNIARDARVDDFQLLLDYTNDMSRFEAVHYFSNPTMRDSYLNMASKMGVNDAHDDFIEKLHITRDFIKTLHEQREQIRIQKEEQDKRENDLKYTRIAVIISALALVSTLFDIINFFTSSPK